MSRPAWHRDAACRTHDPALFFSESPTDLARAKAICAACPVRELCERDGEGMAWGVWGGEIRHRVRRSA